MVTIDKAFEHLGIDYADAVVTNNVKRALSAAVKFLEGAVGKDVETYLPDDPRVEELTLCYLEDFYDKRGVSAKEANATRHMIASTELQLRLELRRAKEAAGV